MDRFARLLIFDQNHAQTLMSFGRIGLALRRSDKPFHRLGPPALLQQNLGELILSRPKVRFQLQRGGEFSDRFVQPPQRGQGHA